MDSKEFLKKILYKKSEIDEWLSGKAFPFSKYDSELGYLHRDRRCKDGIGGSYCTYTYDKSTGARKGVNHPNKPCRINTYGDSYTSCEQGNDGETWQELLAARIGEPIRNFGIGAHSDYQMYLRMRREEGRVPADNVIVNMYCDDHYRSLVGWQRIRVRWWGKNHTGPPQPYVKANPATKEFREFKNPCPEPKDLYDLCSLERAYEHFKDDFLLRIMLAKSNVENGTPTDSYRSIEQLADEYGEPVRISSSRKLLEVANTLFAKSAIYAGMRIVEKEDDFISMSGKKVLYVTSYGNGAVADQIKPGAGPPLPEFRRPGHSYSKKFVQFMRRKNRKYVDLMDVHLADFSRKRLSVAEYLRKYWVVPTEDVSHYSPAGNQFTASAILGELVEMLSPKPDSYLHAASREGWDTCLAIN